MDINVKCLNEFFENSAKRGLIFDEPITYGYYFTDKSHKKLEKVKEELIKQNFKFVINKQLDEDNDDFTLFVEKREILNSQKLQIILQNLNKIADKFEVNFECWDLCPDDE